MSPWIKVDEANIAKTLTERDSKLEIQLYLSPYDIPNAVKGEYCQKRDCFIISFRYLGAETEREQTTLQDGVHCSIGKESRRIYEIVIDVKKLDLQAVTLRVEEAFANMEMKATARLGKRRFRAAKSAYENNKDMIYRYASAG